MMPNSRLECFLRPSFVLVFRENIMINIVDLSPADVSSRPKRTLIAHDDASDSQITNSASTTTQHLLI
jgi:hypothetical protein